MILTMVIENKIIMIITIILRMRMANENVHAILYDGCCVDANDQARDEASEIVRDLTGYSCDAQSRSLFRRHAIRWHHPLCYSSLRAADITRMNECDEYDEINGTTDIITMNVECRNLNLPTYLSLHFVCVCGVRSLSRYYATYQPKMKRYVIWFY